VHSDKAIEDYIRQTCGAAWHPVGTCKWVLIKWRLSILNSRYGVEGLRVVDASITNYDLETNASAIMIGEKAADLIKLEQNCLNDGESLRDSLPPHYQALFDSLARESDDHTLVMPELWRSASQ